MRLLVFFLLALVLAPSVQAVCPVCTIAVAAGVGMLRHYGIDDTITGLWYGSLIVSSIAWCLSFLQKRNMQWKYQKSSVIIGFYVLFVLPLQWMGIIGDPGNTLLGMDKLLFGTIIGSLLFLIAVAAEKKLKTMNEGNVVFYYQKVFIPVAFLTVTSLILHFVNDIVRWY